MFDENHVNWDDNHGLKKFQNIIWSDESKIIFFGSDGRTFV